MALPVEKQLRYWGIAAAVVLLVLWLLGNVLLPFVLGAAVAYLLDPIADRLERLGLSRTFAVAIISVAFLLLVIFVALAIVPTLVRQSIDLVNSAPDLLRNLRTFLDAHVPGGINPESAVGGTLASVGDSIKTKGVELLNTVVSSAVSFVNLIILFFIVPVVSVYLLIDWDHLVARIDKLLPRDHAPVIRDLAGQIDRTLASFIRGQGLVCLIQGSFYAIALMAAGLNFGMVIGAVAGLLTFIPMVGSIVGGVLAIGLAAFQFWGDWLQIALIAGIFFFGQIVEGNFLTPKLVGSSVGLHPVWLLLALSVFGTLFGFVGMLVAVPLAASLGVLVRFATSEYLDSRLYRGHEGLQPEDIPTRDAQAE
ncbi:MAG: AI-2E family transporter [Rhodobacteraceae bacterium]|nr:AI-2E family transporter [Paracoccaceae bacterium]